MKIIDNRLDKVGLNVGDFLVDSEGEMSLVVSFNGFGDYDFGILSLLDLDIIVASDSLTDLLSEYKNDCHLQEIVPQEKVSLQIS